MIRVYGQASIDSHQLTWSTHLNYSYQWYCSHMILGQIHRLLWLGLENHLWPRFELQHFVYIYLKQGTLSPTSIFVFFLSFYELSWSYLKDGFSTILSLDEVHRFESSSLWTWNCFEGMVVAANYYYTLHSNTCLIARSHSSLSCQEWESFISARVIKHLNSFSKGYY